MGAKSFPTPATAMFNWIASAVASTGSSSLQAAKVSPSAHFWQSFPVHVVFIRSLTLDMCKTLLPFLLGAIFTVIIDNAFQCLIFTVYF